MKSLLHPCQMRAVIRKDGKNIKSLLHPCQLSAVIRSVSARRHLLQALDIQILLLWLNQQSLAQHHHHHRRHYTALQRAQHGTSFLSMLASLTNIKCDQHTPRTDSNSSGGAILIPGFGTPNRTPKAATDTTQHVQTPLGTDRHQSAWKKTTQHVQTLLSMYKMVHLEELRTPQSLRICMCCCMMCQYLQQMGVAY